jgi:acetoin utilization deacetylase AcuC-like enzyme
VKIIFNEKFHDSSYADNGAAATGRMESVVSTLKPKQDYLWKTAQPATEAALLLAHTPQRIDEAKLDKPLYAMACLAAGASLSAASVAMAGEPSFACVRPPGHHASRATTWDYCVFCNVAIPLLQLRQQGRIKTALVLDIDAHMGDGTIDVLQEWPEAIVYNPHGDTGRDYLKNVEKRLAEMPPVDILAVSAGFDAGLNDLGHKLSAFDFYQLGTYCKLFTRRLGHRRRFAVLEGGYYLPDLGKNVLAFCEGFE